MISIGDWITASISINGSIFSQRVNVHALVVKIYDDGYYILCLIPPGTYSVGWDFQDRIEILLNNFPKYFMKQFRPYKLDVVNILENLGTFQ